MRKTRGRRRSSGSRHRAARRRFIAGIALFALALAAAILFAGRLSTQLKVVSDIGLPQSAAAQPAPTVPAPRAIVLLKKDRRLMNRFRGFLFSKSSSKGRFSSLLEPFAARSTVVFMTVTSQHLMVWAVLKK